MFRRALTIVISGMVLCSALGYGTARAQSQEANRSAEKARAEVQKLGVNPQRRVEVKLQDGTKLKGSISAAGEDAFTLTEAKTGAARTLASCSAVAPSARAGPAIATTSATALTAAVATARRVVAARAVVPAVPVVPV